MLTYIVSIIRPHKENSGEGRKIVANKTVAINCTETHTTPLTIEITTQSSADTRRNSHSGSDHQHLAEETEPESEETPDSSTAKTKGKC